MIEGQRETTRRAATPTVCPNSARRASRRADPLHFRHLDVPARDLALLFRSRHPLIACETVEEKRFEALVRGVAAQLGLPVWTWSAASGLSPSHPADQPRTADLGVALRHVREASSDGVWLLKDPQAHLENAPDPAGPPGSGSELRGNRPHARPRRPAASAASRSSRRSPSASSSRCRAATSSETWCEQTIRRTARDSPGTRIALTPADVEGLVSDLAGLSLFEAERALARAIVEDNALSPADRPRIRESKKTLVEGGGLLEFVPAPEGMDQVGGLARLKKWIATRRVGFLPGARPEAARPAPRHPAARRPGLRQEPRRQGGRGLLAAAAALARRRAAARPLHRRVGAQPARRPEAGRADGSVRPLDRRDREGLRLRRARPSPTAAFPSGCSAPC